MTDYTPTAPIEVTESAIPSHIMSLIRDGMLGITAWLVGKGYIDTVTGTQIASAGVILATVAWRQYVTSRTHTKLVIATEAAPSSVARLK